VDLDQLEPTDKIIEQFGRQILVPGINEEGQIILANRKVCIIGLGALGTIASQYLVRSGIGEISLIDPDTIEESNLHRQINYDLNDIGELKSEVSKKKLQEINNTTNIFSYSETFESYLQKKLKYKFDIIFDCTDSHQNKILSSKFSKKNKYLLSLYLLTPLKVFIFLKIIKKIHLYLALNVYFPKQIKTIDV
jgi:adenylyltransferase/sulfurtransferase